MKTAREILVGAKMLLLNPIRWTKGRMWLAIPVMVKGGLVYRKCYCSLGAMCKVATGNADREPTASNKQYQKAYKTFVNANNRNPIGLNDQAETSHTDIIKAFNKAIKLLDTQKV